MLYTLYTLRILYIGMCLRGSSAPLSKTPFPNEIVHETVVEVILGAKNLLGVPQCKTDSSSPGHLSRAIKLITLFCPKPGPLLVHMLL